ncbi:DUF6364 family protein [Mucilaginibacter sp. R-33]|uniref:DUF6364 family protein n=1 Tax=unclassified Mucilaginibacter TaxID=2617802 RepID=UPI003CEE76FD
MAKLILDIEPEVLKQAELYADETHTNLSRLIERYLKRVTSSATAIEEPKTNVKTVEIADWVKKLTFSKTPIPDFDAKAEYHKHLDEKYGL